MAGAPPLDAGAKGACLEGSPIESPLPLHGKGVPPRPPCWPTSSPTAAKPSSELASTPILPNAHFSKVPSPSPSPMVSEPTGQQTCRSDTGPMPVIRLPPPSARRCRNN
ncbi:uncharacterized protein N7487_007093 [Penicillium crustosum]|uniref:uncharacterized protein n=1 Tax=Penicillium crustosum TaxID=36656 RepID=UPI00238BD44F|nr:uncharacterized protein N7487_007093 [Penicillium crustosum]KAJ5401197.1 hypothetical protein N7487_007093 [Penicillium crustosum]